MREVPNIVEELRKQEKLGILHNKIRSTMSDFDISDNIPDDESNNSKLISNEHLKNSEIYDSYYNIKSTNVIKNSLQLFDISPETIIIINSNGCILDINDRILNWIGYKKEQLIGKNFFSLPFCTGKYKNNFQNSSIDSIIKNKISTFELDFITINGEKKTGLVSIEPIKKRNAEIIGGLIMISDITEIKAAKEEIYKLNQFQDSVIDNANVWLSAMNLNGNIVIWNKAAEAITGYLREEVLGHDNVWNWLRPEEIELKRDYVTKGFTYIEDEIFSQNFETIIKRKDGKVRTISWNSRNILDKTHNPIGSITLGIDITDQKRSEEKIKRQNEELKKLNRIKSDFLNVTSHELRTPMVAIKGYTQLLSDSSLGEITDMQKKALDVVTRNTDRLNKLVQDILDVSRLESGTMKFVHVDTKIKKVIEEVVETIQSIACKKKIKIQTILNKDLPKIVTDPERIKQVIFNLLINAIKFSPCNSKINIKVKKEKNCIIFEIQDFGRGIPKNRIEKIFDTFYQVDYEKDRKLLGGTGLGLSISRGIILAHGGEFFVKSEEGKGSIFSFTLPLKPVKDMEKRFKHNYISAGKNIK